MSDLLELSFLDEAARAAGFAEWAQVEGDILRSGQRSAISRSIIAHAKSLQKLAELEAENVWRPGEVSAILVFSEGSIHLNRDGSARLVFADDELEWDNDRETTKDYRFQRLPASEVNAIRRFLNSRLPSPPKGPDV
ncbi:hypothetical protein BSL82_09430 [Tardibacter chloracetimidivorans]|uniref:Uncharacterized protein n=1 Tax=Tardibacter chloracetimidivorans TaxID=1921510 RepID=A0A1L3ZV34_9SPHN|nr:hypothetical protein [Tardibacter chloracetimidivorans]API59501.1 hypothetical protein BSL82_09430 [Tardibacter chloracetimidivorans]